jgi:hypothetical protein
MIVHAGLRREPNLAPFERPADIDDCYVNNFTSLSTPRRREIEENDDVYQCQRGAKKRRAIRLSSLL